MDKPEKLTTLGTQDTGRRQTKQINVRENRRGNQELTIQRHWQHYAHKTHHEDKQNTKAQKHNTTHTHTQKDEPTRTPPRTGVNSRRVKLKQSITSQFKACIDVLLF